jgi:hypothetical protein
MEHSKSHKLIPALICGEVSDVERRMISLPVPMGGMGIYYPMETAKREYSASVAITGNLKQFTVNQELTLR